MVIIRHKEQKISRARNPFPLCDNHGVDTAMQILNLMAEGQMAATQLNLTPVITCYRSFILWVLIIPLSYQFDCLSLKRGDFSFYHSELKWLAYLLFDRRASISNNFIYFVTHKNFRLADNDRCQLKSESTVELKFNPENTIKSRQLSLHLNILSRFFSKSTTLLTCLSV